MHPALITHDERPKIVHTPLMLILMMGHGTWLYPLSQWRRAILWLCIVTTESLLNHLTYKIKHHWCSVDAHIQHGARIVCLSPLPKCQPIPHLYMAASDQHSHYQWFKTNTRWRSVDTDFAMGISTICYDLIWPYISLMVFWQPSYHFHVLSPSSIHCSSIIHINIFYKLYFKVFTNCRW